MRTKIAKALIGAALSIPLLATSYAAESLVIFGGENNQEYLGCLTCSEFSMDSVFNAVSRYSWDNSAMGPWNTIGRYRSTIGAYSACNQFASNPPIVVDRNGRFYWRLTINQFKAQSVCAFPGNSQVCEALRRMCEAE